MILAEVQDIDMYLQTYRINMTHDNLRHLWRVSTGVADTHSAGQVATWYGSLVAVGASQFRLLNLSA